LSNSKNYIISCHISGIYDVNRNETIANDDFSVVENWYKSIVNLKLNGIIFHNNFSESTCNQYQNQHVKFIKVDYDSNFNPNVFRYFVYDNYLKANFLNIENVFFTDVSDVLILKNPFQEPLFLEYQNAIFCGDEPEILDNEWMKLHCEHLRNNIKYFGLFEEKFKNKKLLNCGIIGGNINIMSLFIEKLWKIHENYNINNKTNFTGDMGAFNYLIRTQFNEKIVHGKPINTVFKDYDLGNSDCWFAHK
jgi:hypothetical protein